MHSRICLLSGEELLEQLPALQQLLYRLIACHPKGAAYHNYLVQYTLALLKYHEICREKDCLPQVGQWNMANKLKYHETGREKDCLPQVGQRNMANKVIFAFKLKLLHSSM